MKLPRKSITHKKLKTKRSIIPLLIAGSLFATGWLFISYIKGKKYIQQYQQEIGNLLIQRQMIMQARANKSQLEQSIKNLKMSIRSEQMFSTHNLKGPAPQTIAIAKMAQSLGLQLDACVVQNKKRKPWFIKQNVVYEVTGTNVQIQRFIQEIKNEKYALRCKKLALKKPGNQNSINLSCTLQFLSSKFQNCSSTI